MIVLMIFGLFLITSPTAQAAGLTAVSDTLTRLKKSTAANHTIVFTTAAGIAVGNTVELTFATGFNIASVVTADVTIEGAVVTSAVPVGQVLTITAAAGNVVAPAGTADIVIGNSHITNPGTAGSYTISIAGSFGNSGSLAVAIADEDQVSISGTADPYLAFNVTDATVAFGTFSITAVKTDDAIMTAATNSTAGYSLTVNGGTLDDGAGHTITAIGGVAAASIPGSEQFGFKVGAAGGSGAAVAPYATANYAFDIDNVPDEVADSAGVSDTTTFTMTYIANISTLTEPGTYNATHTYICSGNF